MKLWLDAQLPPALARWIMDLPLGLEAVAVRDLGLRDAMTKDRDFIRLLDEQGPPPQVIWLRVGNSSTSSLQQVLLTTLPAALELLCSGEPLVEIRPHRPSGT